MTGVVLCRLADIADGGSNGFVVTRPGGVMPLGMHAHDGRPHTRPGASVAAGFSGLGAVMPVGMLSHDAPGGERVAVLAVRRGAQVFAYVNSCPHTGAPLDFQPGRFLSLDKTLIQCSTHGALFRIEDGFCLAGPCAGKSLERAGTAVAGGVVYLVP